MNNKNANTHFSIVEENLSVKSSTGPQIAVRRVSHHLNGSFEVI